MIREFAWENRRVRVDAGPQILGLDCPERDEPHPSRLEPSPCAAKAGWGPFVSGAALCAKAKAFDDGLVAAVDLAAQRGHGSFPSKLSLLRDLAARLGDGPRRAAVVLRAALRLGAGEPGSGPLEEEARAAAEAFLASPKDSKPLGVYTWNAELERIFRQDRMLQQDVRGPDLSLAAAALRGDAGLRDRLGRWLGLAARFSNPFVHPSLLDAATTLPSPHTPVSILPPSESPEGALVKRLFGASPVPEGFDLAKELAARVRGGREDLTPRPGSGWYDHVVWSLEPLAAPQRAAEAAKLRPEKGWLRHLEELFAGVLALARESQVKQLERPLAACAPPQPALKVRPHLTVEPLATHYLRRAEGYAFVRGVLEESFGSGSLGGLRRLTEAGPAAAPLDAELAFMEALFRGAHATSLAELGLSSEPGRAAPFGSWASRWREDADLARDNRMMVPVFEDATPGRPRRLKVRVSLGWASRPLDAWFVRRPDVEVSGGNPPPVEFEAARFGLARPVTAEVSVARPMNREEFRAHCDRHRTEESILKELA